MQQWLRLPAGIPVPGIRPEEHVGDPAGRREKRFPQPAKLERHEKDGRERDEGERGVEGWKQAANSTGVELPERDPPAVVCGEELLGDQVARDDEEDVDPDEPARELLEAEVKQDDDDDRQRTESIEVRAVARRPLMLEGHRPPMPPREPGSAGACPDPSNADRIVVPKPDDVEAVNGVRS
jgi:hypothetical protein